MPVTATRCVIGSASTRALAVDRAFPTLGGQIFDHPQVYLCAHSVVQRSPRDIPPHLRQVRWGSGFTVLPSAAHMGLARLAAHC